MTMIHIYEDELGCTCFDRYFEYIESIKDKLQDHVYKFASDFKHYSLSDKESLHDAWLTHLDIQVIDKKTNIKIEFLGPFHDRKIHISYIDVLSFDIQKPDNTNLQIRGNDDLLIHELQLKNDYLFHELHFSHGSIIKITSKDIIHAQTLHSVA